MSNDSTFILQFFGLICAAPLLIIIALYLSIKVIGKLGDNLPTPPVGTVYAVDRETGDMTETGYETGRWKPTAGTIIASLVGASICAVVYIGAVSIFGQGIGIIMTLVAVFLTIVAVTTFTGRYDNTWHLPR